jgi:hypothetical protein
MTKTAIIGSLAILFFSCTERSEREPNPFPKGGNQNNGQDSSLNADPNSFKGIYARVLKPTCANSGCHDGTFEPDFRTLEGSYNTLLFRPPIKNDSAGTFAARVVPGNPDLSMLWYRLTVDLGGNSGIMPLVVDPGSDWPARKPEYLQNIRNWIAAGAPDPHGKMPATADQPPQVLGFMAVNASGGSEYPRSGRYEPVQIPYGQAAELWICLADDKAAQGSLIGVKINYSLTPENFDPSLEQSLSYQAGGRSFKSLYGQNEVFGFRIPFSTTAWQKGDVVWIQISASDGVNPQTQIPNRDAMFFLKKYLAIRLI